MSIERKSTYTQKKKERKSFKVFNTSGRLYNYSSNAVMLKTFLERTFAFWNCLLRLFVLWRRKSVPLLYTHKTFSPKTVKPPLGIAILHPLSFIIWICSQQFWPFQTRKYFFKGWKLASTDTVLQALKTIPNVNRGFANGHSVGISIASQKAPNWWWKDVSVYA